MVFGAPFGALRVSRAEIEKAVRRYPLPSDHVVLTRHRNGVRGGRHCFAERRPPVDTLEVFEVTGDTPWVALRVAAGGTLTENERVQWDAYLEKWQRKQALQREV